MIGVDQCSKSLVRTKAVFNRLPRLPGIGAGVGGPDWVAAGKRCTSYAPGTNPQKIEDSLGFQASRTVIAPRKDLFLRSIVSPW